MIYLENKISKLVAKLAGCIKFYVQLQCKQREFYIFVFLVASTVIVYFPVFFFEFINYDTPLYVYDNVYVKSGINIQSFSWALTTTYLGNWHPITWLSHMLDVELFGLNPGGHHFINMFFHIINTILLFFLLKKMTGDLLASCLSAIVFALHPLRVESVVWVAERKDLLCAFFYFLALISYTYYCNTLRLSYYLLVLFFFIMGLMAKPMIVTLPFLLFLLDYWPLNRLNFTSVGSENKIRLSQGSLAQFPTIFIEKVPLLCLTVISSFITFTVQEKSGAMDALEHVTFSHRLGNAFVSYCQYSFRMVWPENLAVLYPYNENLTWGSVFISSFFLIFVSGYALLRFRKYPWFFVGWFWFLGTLVPVIGIVQVGSQAMADRYTYIPSIGFFIIISYFLAKGIMIFQINNKYIVAFTLVITLILSCATRKQVNYWKNGETLFSRTIEVTDNNYIAHHNLGYKLYSRGDLSKAIVHYEKAISLKPDYLLAHLNYGIVLAELGEHEKAIEHYKQALNIEPDYALAHYNLANEYYRSQYTKLAIYHYFQSVRIDQSIFEAYYYLGTLFMSQGKHEEAVELFKKALEINPDYKDAQHALTSSLPKD